MDRETAAELFSAFGAVDVRRMFSGFGIYADDVCFALYLRGEFYLKADETTIPRFIAEGSEHFSYSTRAKTVSVKSWWRMPIRLYDEPEELADWARQAVAVAAKVRLKKVARKKKAAKPGKAAVKAASAKAREKKIVRAGKTSKPAPKRATSRRAATRTNSPRQTARR
jgi:DNA transformation protein and related proteins